MDESVGYGAGVASNQNVTVIDYVPPPPETQKPKAMNLMATGAARGAMMAAPAVSDANCHNWSVSTQKHSKHQQL